MTNDQDNLSKRLEGCYTGVVHDVMRAMGLRNFVLPHEIRPILPERSLAGPVFTLAGHADETLKAHQTYLEWTGFLSRAKPGHVVICQPNDLSLALMGELSAQTLNAREVRGYIVDGGCRDVDFIRERGFQVFCRYVTPTDIVARWLPEALGEPVEIGGVRIATGDYVLGDHDGIVVVPADRAEEIVAETERVMGTENQVRTAIRAGMDPREAYLKHRKF